VLPRTTIVSRHVLPVKQTNTLTGRASRALGEGSLPEVEWGASRVQLVNLPPMELPAKSVAPVLIDARGCSTASLVATVSLLAQELANVLWTRALLELGWV
jgi:hypothetical protein